MVRTRNQRSGAAGGALDHALRCYHYLTFMVINTNTPDLQGGALWLYVFLFYWIYIYILCDYFAKQIDIIAKMQYNKYKDKEHNTV